jgi:hypothetical protein
LLDQVDHAVAEELGVDAEVVVVAEGSQDGVRRGPDSGLDGGVIGDSLGHEAGDAVVDLVGRSGRHLEKGIVGFDPSDDWLTWIWLRPKVRGICRLASRKKRARPMNDAT